MRWNFPAVYVEYKGRALEFFAAEPKYLMEWMSTQDATLTRAKLGIASEEFKTMRPTDNQLLLAEHDGGAAGLPEPGWPEL